jgi:hypothetical protein
MKRHLLSVFAVAAFASFAGAQEPAQPATHGDSVSAMHQSAKSGAKKRSKARRYTSSSAGTIDRGGAGYSVHATARDYVRADDSKADDLFRREQMMDAKCGKNRERCGKP